MKCEKCGFEWEENDYRTSYCPNCKELFGKNSDDIFSMEEALQKIKKLKGDSVFLDKDLVIRMLPDIAPKLKTEKRQLQVVLSNTDIWERLFQVRNKSTVDQKKAIVQSYRIIVDVLGMKEEFATEQIWNIARFFSLDQETIISCLKRNMDKTANEDEDEKEKTMVSNNADLIQKAIEARENGQYEEAFAIFKKLSEQGDINAQNNLGWMYSNGCGVSKDFSQAIYWYEKSAEQGDAYAQYSLGYCFFYGFGIPQDKSKGIDLLTKAAEQGEPFAQSILGNSYYRGNGVQQNYEQAVFWLKKASDQGMAAAQSDLGICYYNGQGVPQDKTIATDLFLKAAEQGDAKAQYDLGRCYYFGYGVQLNYEQAFFWFKKASDQGEANAQCDMAVCYYYGYGVPANREIAINWFKKAANQGIKKAQETLRKLNISF